MSTTPGPAIARSPRRAAPDRAVEIAASPRQRAGGVYRFLRGAAVLLLFGPHLALIRVLGPRLGIRWARFVATLHFLLTFIGAQRQTLRTLRRMQPRFDTPCSPREILRRHLLVKHQSFAEWRLAATPRGRAYLADVYNELPPESEEQLRVLHESEQGVLIVGYHFGMYKLLASALSVVYGVKAKTAAYVSAHYSPSTLGPVARLAFGNAIRTAKASPAECVFLRPDGRPTALFKALRRGEFVGIAADGMISDELIDVPFLGARLRLPIGWARLAAATDSPVAFAFVSLLGAHRRKITVSTPTPIDNEPASIEGAVARGAAALEEQVRQRPWEWHIWGRIGFEESPDGATTLVAAPVTTEPTEVFVEERSRRAAAPATT